MVKIFKLNFFKTLWDRRSCNSKQAELFQQNLLEIYIYIQANAILYSRKITFLKRKLLSFIGHTVTTLQQKNAADVDSLGREKQWPQNGFSEEPARKVHPPSQKPGCVGVSTRGPHPSPSWENLCIGWDMALQILLQRENSYLIYFALTALDNHEEYRAIPHRPEHQHTQCHVTQPSCFQINPFLPLSFNSGDCCHWYSLPWLGSRARASRVRFTLLLKFFRKAPVSPRPVLNLQQLTLKQWLMCPDHKPCLCRLLLCFHFTNIIGVRNANCRGGQGTADECQSCLWVWEEKAAMPMMEAAVGCQASVSGTLHKLHFVSHSLRAPASSVKHKLCWGRVSDGFLLFWEDLGFLEKHGGLFFFARL